MLEADRQGAGIELLALADLFEIAVVAFAAYGGSVIAFGDPQDVSA